MPRIYFNLETDRVLSFPANDRFSNNTEAQRLAHFREGVTFQVDLFMRKHFSQMIQSNYNQFSFYSDKALTSTTPRLTPSKEAYSLLPGAKLITYPFVRIGFDIPDTEPTSSSSGIPSKETLEQFFSTVDIRTLPKEIEVYSVEHYTYDFADDGFIITLRNNLPIMVTELPALAKQQSEASSSQSTPIDAHYPGILKSTKEGLEDAFLDISDAIGDLSERRSLLEQAMGPVNSFATVSDINVRAALVMINSFWNNTNNAASNYHGYNLSAHLATDVLVKNTQIAIRGLISEQVTPVASSSTSIEQEKNASLTQELYLAACQNRVADIKRLLSMGVNPNAVNERGWTPLFAACRGLKTDAVMALLQAPGIDVNIRTQSSGTTPLMTALEMTCQDYFRDQTILIQLMANGADPHIKNNQGQKAIDVLRARVSNMSAMGWSDAELSANVARYDEVLSILMKHQNEVNLQSPVSSSSSSQPSARVQTESVSLLPMAQPEPKSSHARQVPGHSFFRHAQHANNPLVDSIFTSVLLRDLNGLRSLLDTNEAPIDSENPMGETALLIATKEYLTASEEERPLALPLISYLLSKNATFDKENGNGESPLQIAMENNLEELVSMMFDSLSHPAPSNGAR